MTETILEDDDPHLTAVYRVRSKLHLNIEHAKGPLVCPSHRPGNARDAVEAAGGPQYSEDVTGCGSW
ncbi:hypothetical protein [Streptomyces sp. NPDC004629]|uniref:hypothetical protein n=1 Tax=Streptomyces sp. NPDC004629 TaxID=3364705 RepID=UPI0036CFB2D6